jgi:hypothetical protein
MSKLADLLVELGKHGDLYDAYQRDPEAVMRDHQLTEEETEAMLAKDVEKLKTLSGLDNLKSNDSVHAYDS